VAQTNDSPILRTQAMPSHQHDTNETQALPRTTARNEIRVAADVEASVVVPHRAAHGSFARNDRLDRLLYAGFIPSPQPDRFLPLQRSSRESANLTHCAARSLAI
jgi:hypothetical protein